MSAVAQNNLRIRFLGAAETVTGSRYLITINNQNILVDCGLFQGPKNLRLKNWDQFEIDPKSIDAVVLTHAHLDHSGYLPRLIKNGFTGKVFCTHATMALCQILLPDAGYIQEEDAEWLNRKHFSKHSPALPLFTKLEAEIALKQFVPKKFDEIFKATENFNVTFKYAGHILGAAIVIVEAGAKKIAFSGDIGRSNDPIFYPPAKISSIDYLIVESTYGSRQHEATHPIEDLELIINEALQKKGVILIPAFTVGRAQSLMHHLSVLKKSGRIQDVPMYLNSPMATKVTNLYHEFKTLHKLTKEECDDMCDTVYYIRSVEESKTLNTQKGPMLIISASGMATGGRILHHFKAFISDPTTTVILAGFQAAGTRGRALQDGAKKIKIHGEFLTVNANIKFLENISAHADYTEIIDWLTQSGISPRKVFITHGEVDSATQTREHLNQSFDWVCEIPKQGHEFILD